MLKFIFWCFCLWLGWKLVKKVSGNFHGRPSLRMAPETITIIQPSPENFETDMLIPVAAGVPATEGTWLSIARDDTALKKYAADIDNHRAKAENAARKAVTRFEADYRQLRHQQLQLYRRVFQTKKNIGRFKALSGSKLSAGRLPPFFTVSLPSKPAYQKPDEMAKKYTLLPTNTGQTISRLFYANGGLKNNVNIIGIIVYVASLVVRAKANISRQKRLLEDAKGNISSFCVSLRTTVELLAKAHEELVAVSGQIKKSEQGLIRLIEKVNRIPAGIDNLDVLEPADRGNLQLLYFLMLEAVQRSRKPI
jgi:hypothetical protein